MQRMDPMKKISALLMVVIVIVLSLRAFAQDQLNPEALRKQMIEFEAIKSPADVELAKLDIEMFLIASRFENDFANMDDEALRAFINNQKQYYLNKENLTNQLHRMYSPNFTVANPQSIDKELAQVLNRVSKNCNIVNKITSKCLTDKEKLIFQAEYLKQKINALDAIETGLTYQIHSIIVEDDKRRAHLINQQKL